MRHLRVTFARAGLMPRVLTAAVGIPLLLAAAWWNGPWWIGVVVLIVALGAEEFARLHPTLVPSARAAVGLGALLLAAGLARLGPTTAPRVIGAVAAVLIVVVGIQLRAPVAPGTALWSPWPTALLGVIYLGLPGGVLIRWRAELGFAGLLWFLAAIWMNDIAAYFVGLAAGRHKMAPAISPGKSWEGGLTGAAAAGLTAALGSAALGLGPWTGVLLGIMASVTSQAGDLFESAMKRRAGVKDSGALLPGHGGILDRFDGLLVASPVAYVLVSWAGRP